jgi:hypothetical protein
MSESAVMLSPRVSSGIAHVARPRAGDGAHETVNGLANAAEGDPLEPLRGLRARSSRRYLILQRAALLVLPDLRNNMLLVADNSRQLRDVMMVSCSSGSTRTLTE